MRSNGTHTAASMRAAAGACCKRQKRTKLGVARIVVLFLPPTPATAGRPSRRLCVLPLPTPLLAVWVGIVVVVVCVVSVAGGAEAG